MEGIEMPTFDRSYSSMVVEQLLSSGEPGREITTAEMSEAIGLPCDNSTQKGWQVVARLIPVCERQLGLVWAWQKDRACWRCLTNDEKPGAIIDRVKKIRRQTRRVLTVGDTVDYQLLDDASRKTTVAAMTICGAIECLTRSKTLRRLEAVADNQPRIPSTEAVIAACAARSGAAASTKETNTSGQVKQS